MDNLFDQGFPRPWRLMSGADFETGTSMPVDVWETDDALMIQASIPGIKPDNVDIQVSNGVLTIKAERPQDSTEEQAHYYRRELSRNGFARAFSLPVAVDSDKAEARYEYGTLYLTLPKAEVARPKQIKIGATNGHLLN